MQHANILPFKQTTPTVTYHSGLNVAPAARVIF